MPPKRCTSKGGVDPFQRQATRHPGITYRTKANGSRTYFVRDGNSHIRVEGGEREALELQGKLRQRPRGSVAPSTVRFENLAEQWFESKRKLRTWTRANYRDALDRIILPRLEGRKVSSITPQDVAGLIRELEERGLSSSTINNYLLPLNGTLGMAVSRGLIAQNPCALLTKDERPANKVAREQDHVWSDEEIDSLIGAAEYRAKQPESRFDYSPIIRFAVKTGLRLGEILGLQWQDVNFKRKELHVRRQWTRTGEFAEPKTRAAQRRVPLSDNVVAFLRDLHKRAFAEGRSSSLVFPGRNGQPISHRNVQRRGFEPAARLAEIEGVTFHSLRHAFASRMIARGTSSTVLSRLMGHESSIITERRYVHLFDAQRTDEVVRAAMSG